MGQGGPQSPGPLFASSLRAGVSGREEPQGRPAPPDLKLSAKENPYILRFPACII